MEPHATKLVRKILISSLVLLVLFIVAGIGYTWYTGQNTLPLASIETPVEMQGPPILKPVVRAANAPVGVSIQSLDSPVLPGSNVAMTIRTSPGAICTISAAYNKVASKDSGLINKTADDYGMVTWSWSVEKSAPLGKWPVKILCAIGPKSGMMIGDLVIANKLD